MNTIQILKDRKEEIVEKTLEILNDAFSGDRGHRSFYFEMTEENEITVDYLYHHNSIVKSDNYFFYVPEYQVPTPERFGYENMEDVDFGVCGYGDVILGAIEEHIESLPDIRTLYYCQPNTLEDQINSALEYFEIDNVNELEPGQEIDIEIKTKEVESNYNGGIVRHTYTEAFDFDLDNLLEYLNDYYSVQFNVTNI